MPRERLAADFRSRPDHAGWSLLRYAQRVLREAHRHEPEGMDQSRLQPDQFKRLARPRGIYDLQPVHAGPMRLRSEQQVQRNVRKLSQVQTALRKIRGKHPVTVRVLTTLIIVLPFLLTTDPAGAVREPEYYAKTAMASRIKAIAVVLTVDTIEQNRQMTFKRVTFRLKHPFSDNVPASFNGTCFSVDRTWQDPGVGGTIYHYPEKGQTVFVTIAADGGSITSYTVLDEESEKRFIKNPGKIRYSFGKASVEP